MSLCTSCHPTVLASQVQAWITGESQFSRPMLPMLSNYVSHTQHCAASRGVHCVLYTVHSDIKQCVILNLPSVREPYLLASLHIPYLDLYFLLGEKPSFPTPLCFITASVQVWIWLIDFEVVQTQFFVVRRISCTNAVRIVCWSRNFCV